MLTFAPHLCYSRYVERPTRLHLSVLLQALEDLLSYELGLSMQGQPTEAQEELYDSAVIYVSQYPSLLRRLRTKEKREWLEELQSVKRELE